LIYLKGFLRRERFGSIHRLTLSAAALQFLDRGQDPTPDHRAVNVASLKKLIGARTGELRGPGAAPINQQLGGTINVEIVDHVD
jgi:hypothetical protein